MAKCIYCLRNENETKFSKREHVIPDSLGSFNHNPTLLPEYGVVCDSCNAGFSPLEANFIEDTWEGVQCQRLGLKNRSSVTIRGKNLKIERMSGFGDDFFDRMFFFLEFKEGKIVPVLKDQIKLKRFDDGYRVFLPEALESIREGSSEHRKKVEHFKKLNQKDMHIFAETREGVDRMIGLLKKFGVTYNEKAYQNHYLAPNTQLMLEEKYQCTLDMDIGRVLTKIAFNYLAYCAVQSGRTDVLYTQHFDCVRKFVALGEGELKNLIPSISEKPFLHEEATSGGRLLAHVIALSEEDGNVVARLTFLGLPTIYKIVLGSAPSEFRVFEFGCGHAFIPFNGAIINLSQRMPMNPTEDQMKLTFGLFKRVHVQ